jgi:hypothetical protein
MTTEERREVDRVCLELLGHKGLKQGPDRGAWFKVDIRGFPSSIPQPSESPALVAPLAEALRARGYHLEIASIIHHVSGDNLWRVRMANQHYESPIVEGVGPSIQEALASAAARAVEEK